MDFSLGLVVGFLIGMVFLVIRMHSVTEILDDAKEALTNHNAMQKTINELEQKLKACEATDKE